MGKNHTSINEDPLVTMHREARVKKKKKFMITLVTVIIVALTAITAAVFFLQRNVRNQVRASESNEVQSAEVTIGNIHTTVSGSGTLEAETVEELEVLSSLEITDYYVEKGDHVQQGDLIATVTNSSLMTAMSDIQDKLDDLDEELEEVSEEEVSEYIKAGAAGRVKKIYAESGEDVASVMYDDGALLLLSLDGYMVVEITADTLQSGDEVQVLLSDGSSVSGLVEKLDGDVATVLVTDNGTTYEDEVTIYDMEENQIGTGKLDIHSRMAVVGYAGTISSVSVSENEKVSAGQYLFKLKDTETSANYDTLLQKREDTEDLLNDLIKIYKEGGICASVSGTVDSIENTADNNAAGYSIQNTDVQENESNETTVIAAISSDSGMEISISVDETDILSLTEGQEAVVTIDSIGEETFSGIVAEVNTSASSDSGVTAYSAVIRIDKTEQMLSGMSASVVITIEGSENAMLIPIDALHQTSSTAYVYTEYDENSGEFSGMKEVSIGLSNSSYVEIKEGLNEGETVYYAVSEEISSPFENMGGFGNMENGMPGGEMPGGGNMSRQGGFSGEERRGEK